MGYVSSKNRIEYTPYNLRQKSKHSIDKMTPRWCFLQLSRDLLSDFVTLVTFMKAETGPCAQVIVGALLKSRSSFVEKIPTTERRVIFSAFQYN